MNDNLDNVQTPTVQANSCAGQGKNPGRVHLADGEASTSKSGHIVDIVEQPGQCNYPVGIPTLTKELVHSTHDDSAD